MMDIYKSLAQARASQDMDGTLHTDFTKSQTVKNNITKILDFLQLRKMYILTKFGGFSLQIGPVTLI